MICNSTENSEKFPKIQIGDFIVTDYCAGCPNKEKCDKFSFTTIMYSKIPSILATSLSQLKYYQLTEEEYSRLVTYNVKYISHIEELNSQYRKSLLAIQYANFNFSTEVCVVVDDIFHILLRWFEKLVLWNRVNSIKAEPCTYYKELLCENIQFVKELIKQSIDSVIPRLSNVIEFDMFIDSFTYEVVESTDRPMNNGEYFNHTELIKDKLIFYLEALLFFILSYDRTLQSEEGKAYLYVNPAMFIIPQELTKKILLNIIGNNKKVDVKVVTKGMKSELFMRVQVLLKDVDVELVAV